MKKKIGYLFISIIAIIFSFSFIKNVFGANTYSLSITGSDTATKGSTITLTLNLDPTGVSSGMVAYQGTLNYDKSKLEYVNMTNSVDKWGVSPNPQDGKVYFMGAQGMDLSAPVLHSQTAVAKISFKVSSTASGSTTITITDIAGSNANYDSLTASATSKTITIGDPVVTKSSDATLSKLKPSVGTLSPAFTSGNTSYSLKVPNDTTSVSFDYATSNNKAKVNKISGNNDLSVGNNVVKIEVEAEDGSKKIYTINVERSNSGGGSSGGNNSGGDTGGDKGGDKGGSSKPSGGSGSNSGGGSKTPSNTKSSNNNLKAINGIDGLNFSPSVTDYTIEVPNEITSLDITGIAQSSKAKVSYKNNHLSNMQVGEMHTVIITVTAEDSSVKIYTVNVKRGAVRSQTGLEKLLVNDKNLIKENEERDTFNLTVPYDTDEITIDAIPKSEGSIVKIIGNTKLKNGNNKIVVEVTDKNGYTKSYTVNVKKEPKSWLFDFIDKYWIILLLLPLIIMLILMYMYFKNERIINRLDESQDDLDERKALEKGLMMRNDIDNDNNILYNSNSRVDTNDYDKTDLDNLLNDDSVSDFEVKIARNNNSRKYRRR